MKHIGERISYQLGDDDLVVYIKGSSKKDKNKVNLLKIWVVLWTLLGSIMFAGLFMNFSGDEKLFILIYMFFWGYFEYKIAYAYYFRQYGLEVVYVQNETVVLRRDILTKKGKEKRFELTEKNPFKRVNDKNVFISNFYNSFWVVAGGTISFGNAKKEQRFGSLLIEEDAVKLTGLMNKAYHQLRNKNKNHAS